MLKRLRIDALTLNKDPGAALAQVPAGYEATETLRWLAGDYQALSDQEDTRGVLSRYMLSGSDSLPETVSAETEAELALTQKWLPEETPTLEGAATVTAASTEIAAFTEGIINSE